MRLCVYLFSSKVTEIFLLFQLILESVNVMKHHTVAPPYVYLIGIVRS